MGRNGKVNFLLCGAERTGGSSRGCRRSTLQGGVLGEKLLKRREAVFAGRVLLCKERVAPGLPPLPLSRWMLNQLFVWPHAAQGTNPLAEGWGKATNKGFIVGWLVCLQTACCRLALARQTKPPELLLGFPSCKRFAGWSRRRCPGPTGKRVAGVACSCVPPSSARLRLQPLQPAGRGEGGGKWGDKNKLPAAEPSMRAGSYHKATALMGATGPTFPSPLPCSPCSTPAAQKPR